MTEPRMTHEQARDLAAAYVLGALERSEEAAVRDHLATCVEPHPEFEAFGGVVAALDLVDLELVEPPAALGARIMAAAAADLAAHPRASATPTTAARPGAAAPPVAFPTAAERTERTVRAERTRASRFDWALRIAAVIAIVAVGYWGLDLQRQLDRSQRFERAVASVVQTAAQAGSKTVILAASGDARASGIGAVAPDGSVVLAMRDLPATSGSQVYEAWVIVGKAAPIAVGGFTVDSNGTASFTTRPAPTPAGAVIALTLEPNEGNTAPTLPIIAAGQAVAPPASS
jgi:anti-sigma-K factor RskA